MRIRKGRLLFRRAIMSSNTNSKSHKHPRSALLPVRRNSICINGLSLHNQHRRPTRRTASTNSVRRMPTAALFNQHVRILNTVTLHNLPLHSVHLNQLLPAHILDN